MKTYIYFGLSSLIFVLLTASTFPHSTPKENAIQWVSLEEAQELTKSNPKKVFIDVYTTWCGYCKKMDRETFSNEEVINYVNENFYAIKLNAGSKETVSFNGKEYTEQELARAFRVSGYPTIVFVNEQFNEITPVPGFRKSKDFLEMLESFVKHK
ncbi:MAG: thioredoxin fold domain-containing protein [Cyclobacteriaceae bacterium]|nr:thioredoxin fold domain-containing protein [Cyclobacteriaceae bacterium]MCH8517759.1 thioredoxin fold domain-containing protein [Cyclobacteriaceae bacterium]